MSSSLEDVSQAIRADAKAIVKALVNEMAFPYPMRAHDKNAAVSKLHKSPPDRNQLSFQTHSNKNPTLLTAAKNLLAKDVSYQPDEASIDSLFCMAHGEFVRVTGMDLDHNVTFARIRENQQAFLDFLNDPANKVFTNEFLQQKNISDFFRWKDGKSVQGSNYFYRMCYNNLDNLCLMCHACNIEKNDADPLKWFLEKKHFGVPFLQGVKGSGGLNPGVIFDRVGGQVIAQLPIGLKQRSIYSGGMGLGQYAREWFLKQHAEEYALWREHQATLVSELRCALEAARELRFQGNDQASHQVIANLQKKLHVQYAVLKDLKFSESSGSDTSAQEATRQGESLHAIQRVTRQIHWIKALQSEVTRYFEQADQTLEPRDVDIFFDALSSKICREEFNIEETQKFYNSCSELLSKYAASVDKPDWSHVQLSITSRLQTTVDRVFQERVAREQAEQLAKAEAERADREARERQAEAERADREAREKQAEAERADREAREKQAEAERADREAKGRLDAEQRVEEMERRLVSLQRRFDAMQLREQEEKRSTSECSPPPADGEPLSFLFNRGCQVDKRLENPAPSGDAVTVSDGAQDDDSGSERPKPPRRKKRRRSI